VIIPLLNLSITIGKRIYATQEYYRPSRVTAEFSEVIQLQQPALNVTMPPEEFHKLMPLVMADDLTEMGQSFAWPGYYGGVSDEDVEGSRILLQQQNGVDSELTTWKKFVKRNLERFV
jgi:hypothetical protein